ncbi:hypothetical protein K490DRAFT_66683 [Saccharata proteae CBS 121410]|uniref:Uncharacterized protein n=1 Tax=Saccharata proteae CBS 121410 TaxID=1314787 RepID=A0A9P4LXV9_9PEZI|nr:hypothetical protein K490DRAFT_66683 [Saccharata proteae CBS 121410]
MCKLHGYRYRCGHQNSHRLSRCRGSFFKQRRLGHGNVPACLSTPYLEVVSPSLCGPCQHDKFNKEWTNRIRLAENALNVALYQWEPTSWTKSGEPPPPDHKVGGGEAEVDRFRKELETINADYETKNWTIRHMFPTNFRPVYPRLKICAKKRGTSPLRNEVRPEDVVLASERKSRSSKRDELGTFQSFFRGRYSNTGPQIPDYGLGYGSDEEDDDGAPAADSG